MNPHPHALPHTPQLIDAIADYEIKVLPGYGVNPFVDTNSKPEDNGLYEVYITADGNRGEELGLGLGLGLVSGL